MAGARLKPGGLVVDGEEDAEKVRQLIAGLRLLKAYGKVAEYALKRIREGKDVAMYMPLVERRGRSSKGRYEVSPAAVHTSVQVPPLPDYSDVTCRLENMKDDKGRPDKGYLVYIRTLSAGLSVYPKGRIVRGALEGVIGSVRPTKNGFAWSFSGSGSTKRTQAEVRKSIAEVGASVIVKLASDGHGQVWHSQAKHVREVLRARSSAKLLAEGMAEAVRVQAEAEVAVDSVHAR